MDAKREMDEHRERTYADHARLNELDAQLLKRRHELEDGQRELERGWSALHDREADLPKLRSRIKRNAHQEGVAAAQVEVQAAVEERVATVLAPASAALERQHEELDERLAHCTLERDAYRASAAEFVRLCRTIQPLVQKWEQQNPHTERGAKAQSMAERVRQIERRAAEIRARAPQDDQELGA